MPDQQIRAVTVMAGGCGDKKTRQQKVQTANKVEGLRRQWRKDLGRSPG